MRLEGRVDGVADRDRGLHARGAAGLRNVLENAIRHTPTDGTVVVEAAGDETEAVRLGRRLRRRDPGGRSRADLRGRLPGGPGPDGRAAPGSASRSHAASSRPTTASIRAANENGGARFTVRLPACAGRVIGRDEGARHRRRRVHRLARRRRAARPRATRCACSTASPSPTLPAGVEATIGDVDRCRRRSSAALRGVDAVCHQAAKVGLGVDFGDAVDYVRDNDLGTAVLLRRDARRPVSRAARARVEHGRLRRGPLPVPGRRRGRARSARPVDLDAGRFEPPCPECGRALDAGGGAGVGPARPAQRLRRVEGRPGAPRRGVRARAPGGGRDRAPLPQRLRPGYAPRHAVRRGRGDLRRRARRRSRAAGLRGRRSAPRLRPRP